LEFAESELVMREPGKVGGILSKIRWSRQVC
jgi:hypothetical protein